MIELVLLAQPYWSIQYVHSEYMWGNMEAKDRWIDKRRAGESDLDTG